MSDPSHLEGLLTDEVVLNYSSCYFTVSGLFLHAPVRFAASVAGGEKDLINLQLLQPPHMLLLVLTMKEKFIKIKI